MISDADEKNIDQIRTWYAERGSDGLADENCESLSGIMARRACRAAGAGDGIIDSREKRESSWSGTSDWNAYINMICGHDGRDLLRLRAGWLADHARTLWHRFDDSAEERLGYLRELISIRRSTSFSPEDSKKIATHLTELMNDKSETDPGLHLAAMEALDAMGDTGRINLPMLDHLQNSSDARIVEGAAALTGKVAACKEGANSNVVSKSKNMPETWAHVAESISNCDTAFSEEMFQHTVKALNDPDPEVRLKALDALAIIATHQKHHMEEAIDAIASALSSVDSEIRLTSLAALCNCGASAKRALPAIFSLMEQEKLSEEEMHAVIEVIAQIEPEHPDSVALFVDALSSPSETIAASAAEALIRSGTNARTLIFAAAQQREASVLPWAVHISKGIGDVEGEKYSCEALSHAFRNALKQRRWNEVEALFSQTKRLCDEATLNTLVGTLIDFARRAPSEEQVPTQLLETALNEESIAPARKQLFLRMLLEREAFGEVQAFLQQSIRKKDPHQKEFVSTFIDVVEKSPKIKEIPKELLSSLFSTLARYYGHPHTFALFDLFLKKGMWETARSTLNYCERGEVSSLLRELGEFLEESPYADKVPLDLILFAKDVIPRNRHLFREILKRQEWREARIILEKAYNQKEKKAAHELSSTLIEYAKRDPRVPHDLLYFARILQKAGDKKLPEGTLEGPYR